jgi:hypothetical protein
MCPELKSIDLSGTAITDVAIFALAEHCTGLRSISARGCNITDACIPALQELRELTEVDLRDTHVIYNVDDPM